MIRNLFIGMIFILSHNLYLSAHVEVESKIIKIPMRDGINLTADLFLPEDNVTLPVILVRTPYGKHQHKSEGEFWASNGYAVVIQDTRGKWDSEGEFSPFVNELDDGLATLDWISEQSWCNGDIGMWGSSYLTHTAMILAAENHPALKTVFGISGWLTGERIINPGGTFHLQLSLPWMLHEKSQKTNALSKYDMDELFEFLPVSSVFDSLGIAAEFWEEALEEEESLEDQYNVDNIDIPIFHMTGWYDFVHDASLDIYKSTSLKKNIKNKLMIGPWFHDQFYTTYSEVGDEDFGPESVLGAEKMRELSLQWFDHILKNKTNGIDELPEARIFIMGENKWRDFDAFPPQNVKYEKFYLGSNSGANSLNGDGMISKQKPLCNANDTFVFDPLNPVPTYGGANFHFFLYTIGVKDQTEIEKRSDVLVYTSDVLEKDLEIVGPVSAVVYASTEGKDTDFTAKLVEVYQNGYAKIITEGIIRASHRNTLGKKELLEPGKVYRLEIDLGSTGIRIGKGSKVRLEVSSSNFPKYARNPNTGEDPYSAKVLKTVNQKIYFGEDYPSHLILPVIHN